jgi:hypothetical protein
VYTDKKATGYFLRAADRFHPKPITKWSNPSMQLIQAKISGQPRTVSTKHGDRSVVDARAANGENLTIWRPANDPAVMRLANGERVQLAIDAKGKISLVETAFDRAEANRPEIPTTIPNRPMGFQPQTESRSQEISDYISKLGKLYGHCLTTAQGSEPVALAIFQQSIEHFAL